MDYAFEASARGSRRQSMIGAIALLGLAALFAFAIMARTHTDISLVVVAPAGTRVRVDGNEPRRLPEQPNTSSALASFHFTTTSGAHQVIFQEPGKPQREQTIELEATRLPVIYTLLRDSLRELQSTDAE